MISKRWLALSVILAGVVSCAPKSDSSSAESTPGASAAVGGQSAVQDDESQPNVVKVAVGSKDHTTLVTALQAANLVDALANAGPFTVFAPTNAAFDKLPKGTVEGLLKAESKPALVNVLYHHVITSARDIDSFTDGDTLIMVDGTSEVITRKGGDTFLGSAKVIGSVRASNGWVHVVDGVVVPAGK